MDYEKKYKEALERAKELHGTVAAGRDFLAEIFPELAESEDERIREWLITQLQNNYMGNYWAIQAIAYLEKQKEHQKKTDAPEEKSVGGNFLSSHKDKILYEIAQDYVDGVKEYNSEPTWDLMETAVCYGYLVHKEQMEKNRLVHCDSLTKEEYDIETAFADEIIEKENRTPTFIDAIKYGMKLQKEQKPEEWDELQAEFRNINEAFEEGKKEVVAKPERYGLRQATEWSEEDEDNIDKVIDLLYVLDSYIGDDCTITQEKTEELRNCIQKTICPWLKSLRPQSRQEISYQSLTAREKELLEGKQVEGPMNCRNCRKEKHCFREDTHWGGPCEDYEREEGRK